MLSPVTTPAILGSIRPSDSDVRDTSPVVAGMDLQVGRLLVVGLRDPDVLEPAVRDPLVAIVVADVALVLVVHANRDDIAGGLGSSRATAEAGCDADHGRVVGAHGELALDEAEDGEDAAHDADNCSHFDSSGKYLGLGGSWSKLLISMRDW